MEKRKIIATVLGALGVFLWFMPLVNVTSTFFQGMEMYQAGNHIGGIAYLLIISFLAYGILSWIGQHVPRIIAASVALAISLLFLLQAGGSAAWGLYGLIIVSIAGITLAVYDKKAETSVEKAIS